MAQPIVGAIYRSEALGKFVVTSLNEIRGRVVVRLLERPTFRSGFTSLESGYAVINLDSEAFKNELEPDNIMDFIKRHVTLK